MKELRMVLVEWDDSSGHSDSPWVPHDAVVRFASDPDGLKCRSVGFLVHQDRRAITIAQSYTLDEKQENVEMVGSPTTIPRVAITRMRTVEKRSRK